MKRRRRLDPPASLKKKKMDLRPQFCGPASLEILRFVTI
jgi:hypothetical protein